LKLYLLRRVDIPKGRYSGHVLIKAVASGTMATRPHQDLKYIPAAAMTSPMTTLIHLSVIPIFFFMTLLF
jgi:hypothetical protein